MPPRVLWYILWRVLSGLARYKYIEVRYNSSNVTGNTSIIACCVVPRVEFGNGAHTMDRNRRGF